MKDAQQRGAGAACDKVVLVGLRGTGKSSLLPELARLLDWRGVDLDQAIAAEVGMGAGAWLQQVGELTFRRREAALAAALLDRTEPMVLAFGGGAVLAAATRARLRRNTVHCIWLRAPLDVLAARIARSAEVRPPLTGVTGRSAADELTVLAAQREPLYRAVADRTVETGARTPAELAALLAPGIPR